MAGNAVVDRNQQVRLQRGQFVHQRRRQAIAVHHAVRHRVEDMLRAEHAQAAHAHRAGGSAITIEIADHQDALVIGDGLDQQAHRCIDAGQQFGRMKIAQLRQRQLRGTCIATGVEPRQQRQLDGCTASAARDIGIAGYERQREDTARGRGWRDCARQLR
ncbi:hypothetical protein G6F57_021173 [Rhizopus arrhizus]|nr:hypothetical protein G6F57_021173 [Rhizopus arrhizus]